MPDHRYKTPNGKIVSEATLQEKYGDKFNSLVADSTFVAVNENVYKTPNGTLEAESVLKEKYGDRFDSLVENNTFALDYQVKKKDDSKPSLEGPKLDSKYSGGSSGSKIATLDEQREAEIETLRNRIEQNTPDRTLIESYNKATSLSEEDKEQISVMADQLISDQDGVSKFKQFTVDAQNFMSRFILPTSAKDIVSGPTIKAKQPDSYAAKNSEKVDKYLKENQWADTPKMREMALKKIAENEITNQMKQQKVSEYLSVLSDEEKKQLELDQIAELKTLEDTERLKMMELEMDLKSLQDVSGRLSGNEKLIEDYIEKGQEVPPELAGMYMEKVGKIKAVQEKYQDFAKDLEENIEKQIDGKEAAKLIQRNYKFLDNMDAVTAQGIGRLYEGAVGFGAYLLNARSGMTKAGAEIMNEYPGVKQAAEYLSEKDRVESEALTEKAKDVRETTEKISEQYRPRMKYDQINDLSDVGYFISQEIATQLPILAVISNPISATGGISAIGATSAGEKFTSMKLEEDNPMMAKSYNSLEEILAPALYGSAEAVLGAAPTSSILRRTIRSAAERQLLNEGIKAYSKQFVNDNLMEVGTEVATTFVQNGVDRFVLGDKSVSMARDLDHTFFQTMASSPFITGGTKLASEIFTSMAPASAVDQVKSNLKEIEKLQLALNDASNDEVRSVIEGQISEKKKENDQIVQRSAKNIADLDEDGFNALKDIVEKQAGLKAMAEKVAKDKGVSRDQREAILKPLASQYDKLEKQKQDLFKPKEDVENETEKTVDPVVDEGTQPGDTVDTAQGQQQEVQPAPEPGASQEQAEIEENTLVSGKNTYTVTNDDKGKMVFTDQNGKTVPEFTDRKLKGGGTKKVRNGNYSRLVAKATGEMTQGQIDQERKTAWAEAQRDYIPQSPEDAVAFELANGMSISRKSIEEETGEKAANIFWASSMQKEESLPSIERAAEMLAEKYSEFGMDDDGFRDLLIDELLSAESRMDLQDQVIERQKALTDPYYGLSEADQLQAMEESMTEAEESLLESVLAEEGMSDQEKQLFYQEQYEKSIDALSEEQQNEIFEQYELDQQGQVDQNKSDEKSDPKESQGEETISTGVNISESLKLPELISAIDEALEQVDLFGQETLGMNLPVVVAKRALQAMKLAAVLGKNTADVISAGINEVKQTSWYKKLTDDQKTDVEKNFYKYINAPFTKAKKARTRGEIVEDVEAMRKLGTSDKEIIESFGNEQERMIAEDHISRGKPVDKATAKKIVEESYRKADEALNKPSNKSWVTRTFRKYARAIWDAGFVPKFVLNMSGKAGRVVRNYIITMKGASGYSKFIFDQAYKKIYWGLSSSDKTLLDKIIQERRIIAIDKNREERGLDPVVHPDNKTGAISQAYLDGLKEELGSKKFNDFNKRADAYFDEFRNLLDAMYQEGIINKKTRDMFFDVDYQPRLFIEFLENAEGELMAEEPGQNRSTKIHSIEAMTTGNDTALVYDSELLLSRAINVRAKSIAVNRAVLKLDEYMVSREAEIKKLKEKESLTPQEKKQIKYFEELSQMVKRNPVTGLNAKNEPQFLYDRLPKGYKYAYYYRNGVQYKVLMRDDFHTAFYNTDSSEIMSHDAREAVSYISGTALVKALATGNNPTFFISNTPRDLLFIATFSDVYGSVVPLNIAKIIKDSYFGIKDIRIKSDRFRKFVQYGGMMDYLHQQGKFKGTTGMKKLMDKAIDRRARDMSNRVFKAVFFDKLQMYSEIGFRMAVFNRSIKQQLRAIGEKDINTIEDKQTVDDIYTNAVAAARGTTDFNQGGRVVKALDSAVPYLNASVQGTRVAIDAIHDRPIETMWRMTQTSAIMTAAPMMMGIALISALRGSENEPEEEKDMSSIELYLHFRKGVSMYERVNYMLIPTGKRTPDGEFKYFRLAKSHFLTPIATLTESIQVESIKDFVGDESSNTVVEDMRFALEKNVSPVDFNPMETAARIPLFKAWATYTTGYDFFRERDLSYLRGKVPEVVEGYENSQVEDFYKVLGEEYRFSPVRMKGAVESLITSPSTNPAVGFTYSAMDAFAADQDGEKVMKKLGNDILKSTQRRVYKETTEFNRRLSRSKIMQRKIEDIEIESIKTKNKFKALAEKYTAGEIKIKEATDQLKKVYADSPYEGDRMLNKFVDVIENQDTSPYVFEIKYAKPKVRAVMLVELFGDKFLKGSKGLDNYDKKVWRQLWTHNAVNDEALVEYHKLIQEINEEEYQ